MINDTVHIITKETILNKTYQFVEQYTPILVELDEDKGRLIAHLINDTETILLDVQNYYNPNKKFCDIIYAKDSSILSETYHSALSTTTYFQPIYISVSDNTYNLQDAILVESSEVDDTEDVLLGANTNTDVKFSVDIEDPIATVITIELTAYKRLFYDSRLNQSGIKGNYNKFIDKPSYNISQDVQDLYARKDDLVSSRVLVFRIENNV